MSICQFSQAQVRAVGEWIIHAQDDADGVGAQNLCGDACFVEGRAGESDVDTSGAQSRCRVGEVAFSDVPCTSGCAAR